MPAICGMVVQSSSSDVLAQVELAVKDISVFANLIQTDDLDAVFKAAIQQPACQEAEWMVIGNFSSLINIDEIVRHHGTQDALIVTLPTFDWSLGLV